MKWQKGNKRRRKRGRKIKKLPFSEIADLASRGAFKALIGVFEKEKVSSLEFIGNGFKDTFPMYLVRKYIHDDFEPDKYKKINFENAVALLLLIIRNPLYDPNQVNIDGDTLLHLLCKAPVMLPVVTELVNHKLIDVNLKNKFDCTPLDICICYANDDAYNVIIAKGGRTAEEVEEKIKESQNNTYASLEEYRKMKEEMFTPKIANIRRLLDPSILEKNWI